MPRIRDDPVNVGINCVDERSEIAFPDRLNDRTDVLFCDGKVVIALLGCMCI
jgi:hypothetical protein